MWKIYGLDIRELTGQGLLEEYLCRLSKERQAHIRKIKSEAEQYRSLGAGLLLAYGLTQTGVPAEDRELSRGIHGKPYLTKDAGVCFNMSHSGDYAVAVFSDREVGIDIERRRTLRKGVAERSCTAQELAWLSHQEDKEMAFVRLWTAKESYVKWSGEGLTCPLAELEIQLKQSGSGETDRICGEVLKRAGSKEPVAMHEYPAPKDYGICTCISAGGEMVSEDIRWLTVEELMRG